MNQIRRKASVQWKGGSRGATTKVTSESGALKRINCSLAVTPANDSNTDPTELIAAAQASCFSLALAKELGLEKSLSGKVLTTATVTMEELPEGWAISRIHLNVAASLPNVTHEEFIDATVRAKMNCVVSKLVRANISMTAHLMRESPHLRSAAAMGVVSECR